MRGVGHMDYLLAKRQGTVARLSPTARHLNFPQLYRRPADAVPMVPEPAPAPVVVPVLAPEPPPGPPLLVLLGVKKHTCVSIARVVCEHWALGERDFFSRSRPHRIARVRFAAYSFCRILTGLSLPQIGRALGGLDHTTIMHGLRRAAELHASDADWRTRYDATALALKSGDAP